jgi:hypothetical protein
VAIAPSIAATAMSSNAAVRVLGIRPATSLHA